MADGYLESHYAEYEKKKAVWLRKKNSLKLKVESLNTKKDGCKKDSTDPAR